jgi:hypothetical protein
MNNNSNNKLSDLLGDRVWPAIVEDINDPLRTGRVKARVKYIFDDIDVEDLPWASPWKSLYGKGYKGPDKGQIVNVTFFNGDVNSPEYFASEHFDINLQTKLEEITPEDYKTFAAIYYDKDLRIIKTDSDGFSLDYKNSKLNINENSDVTLQLKDNNTQLNLGDIDATQKALLTDHFFDWFSNFISALKNNAYIGNLGAPVVTGPQLMSVITQFDSLKDTFMSKHVFIVDNDEVTKQDAIYSQQEGDIYKSFENESIIDIKNEKLNKKLTETEKPKVDLNNKSNGIDEEDISIVNNDYNSDKVISNNDYKIYLPVKYERQKNKIGCLATSISMAINYLKNKIITSESDILNNYADSNNNISFTSVVKTFGNKAKKIPYTESNILKTISDLLEKNNKPVIIKVKSISKPNRNDKQHFVLAIGITNNNQIVIHDPNRGKDNIVLDNKRLHSDGYIGIIS